MALWRREARAACAVYGPGNIAHAHAVDEQVSIDEVATTARVLEAAVRRLLQAPS
jgi:acetylornithine deacetylase/succinyl-diaminopimelate desuccinylase-like protein